MKTDKLAIHLLGPVEILQNQKPLKIKRRLERAILYYLAIENRPVSRTTLIDLFWPDSDQVDPRAALRTALSRLRNNLPDPDILITELDQVWLNCKWCDVDVLVFKQLYHSLKNLLNAYKQDRTLPAQIAKQIHEALDIWQGDILIDGDHLEKYPEIELWRRHHQQELTHHRGFLTKRLAEHYRATGELEQSLVYFTKISHMDLLDTSIHLAILEILTKLGRHQEVIDYCDSLEVAFERQYNAPLPEIILSRYQYAQIQLNASHQQRTKDWPAPLTMKLSLVGRQNELSQLQQAFFSGGLVMIRSELGSGKTRLVEELFHTVNPTPKLFYAPSSEMESSLPFSPIIHALRRHIPQQFWLQIEAVWANQMSLLLPELKELRNDIDPSAITNYPSGKQHLFDAIHQVFRHVAQKTGRVLLFLDDAQWSDKQTLQALAYLLIQGFFDEEGLLVIASRTEEPNPDLDAIITPLYRNRPIQTITLGGLSPNEIGKLVEQTIDVAPAAGFINKLYQETNGNPFLALEIIRNILELQGDLEELTGASHLPLPESIHALIRNRLNRLDEDAKNILAGAAVIGNTFSLDLLESITSNDSQSDLEIIDVLVQSGFIHPVKKNGVSPTALQFAHEKMREVVLKEVTATRLQALHKRIANRLAQTPQDAWEAAIIAQHYRRAGESRQAFQWLLNAAKHAWSLGAKEDANSAYEQAEAIYRNAPKELFSVEEVFDLYKNWSDFAYQSNQVELLEDTGVKLEYFGERENDPVLVGVSQIALANACFLRMKMATGLEIVNRAINLLKEADQPKILVQALVRKATFYWWLVDYKNALQNAQEALSLSEQLDTTSPEMISTTFYARQTICMSHVAMGNAKAGLPFAQETNRLYIHKLNSFDHLRTFNMLANANFIASNYEACKDNIKKGLEIAHAIENDFTIEIFLVILSQVEFLQGYLDESYIHAVQAIAMGEKSNNLHTIVNANRTLGDVFGYLQNYTRAMKHYRVAQIRAGFSTPSSHRFENNIQMARLLIWMDELPEAKEIIEPTIQETRKYAMHHLEAKSLMISGICDYSDLDLSSAEDKFIQAKDIIEENGLLAESLWNMVGRTRIALFRGNLDVAESLIRDLLIEGTNLNMVWQNLHGLALYKQLCQARGEDSLPNNYQALYDSLLRLLESHSQSQPLKKDFITMKSNFEKGLYFP
jgi:DNA-binding SARP family transcriptional activator